MRINVKMFVDVRNIDFEWQDLKQEAHYNLAESIYKIKCKWSLDVNWLR